MVDLVLRSQSLRKSIGYLRSPPDERGCESQESPERLSGTAKIEGKQIPDQRRDRLDAIQPKVPILEPIDKAIDETRADRQV